MTIYLSTCALSGHFLRVLYMTHTLHFTIFSNVLITYFSTREAADGVSESAHFWVGVHCFHLLDTTFWGALTTIGHLHGD